MLKIAVIGQKWLGAETVRLAAGYGRVIAVVGPAGDRVHKAASRVGARSVGIGEQAAIPAGLDVILSAHCTWRIDAAVRLRARYTVGYHPSLLPLRPGRNAVPETIAGSDRVTGGTLFHLDDGWDTGPVAFQDWCFVPQGAKAEELWRDALAPLGLALFEKALDHLAGYGFVPAEPQADLGHVTR